MGMNEDFKMINLIIECAEHPRTMASKIMELEAGMSKVKQMLIERPFNPPSESIYNLARRLVREIDKDLAQEKLESALERDLARLKAVSEEIIEYEDLRERAI